MIPVHAANSSDIQKLEQFGFINRERTINGKTFDITTKENDSVALAFGFNPTYQLPSVYNILFGNGITKITRHNYDNSQCLPVSEILSQPKVATVSTYDFRGTGREQNGYTYLPLNSYIASIPYATDPIYNYVLPVEYGPVSFTPNGTSAGTIHTINEVPTGIVLLHTFKQVTTSSGTLRYDRMATTLDFKHPIALNYKSVNYNLQRSEVTQAITLDASTKVSTGTFVGGFRLSSSEIPMINHSNIWYNAYYSKYPSSQTFKFLENGYEAACPTCGEPIYQSRNSYGTSTASTNYIVAFPQNVVLGGSNSRYYGYSGSDDYNYYSHQEYDQQYDVLIDPITQLTFENCTFNGIPSWLSGYCSSSRLIPRLTQYS